MTNIKEFLLWWLGTYSNRYSNQVTKYSLNIVDVVADTDYVVIIGEYTYTVNSGSMTESEVLEEFQTLIVADDIFTTTIESNTLYVYEAEGEYFDLNSETVIIKNVTGVIVLEAFSNTQEVLSNLKPNDFPFVTFKITSSPIMGKDVEWGDNDTYTLRKKANIDINVYHPAYYMELAEKLGIALLFDEARVKMRTLNIGIGSTLKDVTNVSAILGGASEGRANFTFSLTTAIKYVNNGISGIINASEIDRVNVDLTVKSKTIYEKTITILQE